MWHNVAQCGTMYHILCHIVKHCATLCHIVPHCTTLYHIVPHCTTLCHIVPYCTTLHNVHFGYYVYLPTEQADTYLKSCVLINYSTYICLCLFGWKVNIVPKMHIVQ